MTSTSDDKSMDAAGKLVIRLLMEHPIQGWRHLQKSRAMALYRGENGIAELANQTVRVATAYVLMEGKQTRSLKRLEIDHWKFDGNGRVDQEAIMFGIIRKLNEGATGAHPQQEGMSDGLSDADIKAIRAALGLTSTPA